MKASEDILRSWKEIGAYLCRNEATVRRWEKEEGLPVHRHSHKIRSSVYAYPREIDSWQAARAANPPREAAHLFVRKAAVVALTTCALAAAVLLWRGAGSRLLRPLVEAAAEDVIARRLWSGTENDASILLNGRVRGSVIFDTDWYTGNIVSLDTSTGARQVITRKQDGWNSGDYGHSPVPSPDGSRIAFTWAAGNKEELRVAPVSGGAGDALLSNPESSYLQAFDWTADGRRILIALKRSDRSSQLALVSYPDGKLQALKSPQGLHPRRASLSPDSRYVIYDAPTRLGAPERDIFLLRIESGDETALIKDPSNDHSAIWMPDGRGIAFISDRGTTAGVWMLPMSGDRPAGPPRLLKSGLDRGTLVGIGSEGAILVGANTGRHGLYLAEADFTQGKLVGEPQLLRERFMASGSLAWSRDGTKLSTLIRNEAAHGAGIVIRDLGTGKERVLYPGFRQVRWAAEWSADGRRFLIAAEDWNQRAGVFLVDAASGDARLVINVDRSQWSGPCIHPVWLGKKDEIVCMDFRDGASRVYLRDMKSGRERDLHNAAEGSVTGGFALASPDGAWVTFRRQRNSTWELVVVSADRGPAKVLKSGSTPGALVPLSWTADSRSILMRDGAFEVWQIPRDGGPARSLTRHWKGSILEWLRVHPDNRRMAVRVSERTAEIWALKLAGM